MLEYDYYGAVIPIRDPNDISHTGPLVHFDFSSNRGGGIGGLTLGVALNNPIPFSVDKTRKLSGSNGTFVNDVHGEQSSSVSIVGMADALMVHSHKRDRALGYRKLRW